MINIEKRNRVLVNTDPQRRCYNGAHYKSELVWTEWEVLEFDVQPTTRIAFWRDLNDYAVSERGEGAYTEYRERSS